ncbi:hypothetical protein quinque_013191 [Culex quinquefasciatus]
MKLPPPPPLPSGAPLASPKTQTATVALAKPRRKNGSSSRAQSSRRIQRGWLPKEDEKQRTDCCTGNSGALSGSHFRKWFCRVASPAAEQTSSTAFKCLVDTVAQNHSSNYLLTHLLNKNQQSEILRRIKNAEADTNQLQQQLASQQPRIPIPQELQFPIQKTHRTCCC